MDAPNTHAWLPACLALASAFSAATSQRPPTEPIAALLTDADGDFLVDRLDDVASIRGVVTAAPYSARHNREVRIYLQDATAAIRCVATDHQLLTDVTPGDTLTVSGTIEHYRGMEQLHAQAIERHARDDLPAPRPVDAIALHGEALLGQLVTITAKLTPPMLTKLPKLEDATGTVELYMPKRFLDDPSLVNRLARGGTCSVVGHVEQNDPDAPFDGGYRLRLRSPLDLKSIPGAPLSTLALAATMLAAGAVGATLWNRRRRKTREEPAGWAEPVDRVQGQKMEALGTLAGGVAHEFNNYLAAIRGYTELANLELAPDSETRRHLDEVITTSEKAKELADKVLRFGRKEESALEEVDIANVTRDGVGLVRATLPANIRLEAQIDAYAGVVTASPNQIQQVLLNLASNAVDAMRLEGGDLRVEVERVKIDAAQAAELHLAAPGHCARIMVTDNGPGMDRATIERMYEPFFTTKEIGVGTGLGLSIVHSILDAHGAGVRVTSRLQQGTRFEIYLPTRAVTPTPTPSPAAPSDAPRGSERVLLVDDTESLARLAARHLNALGYDTQIATEGATALDEFERADPPFDAVVTDFRMPGISGLELAEKLQQLRPGLAVLIVTGYDQQLTPEKTAAAGVHEVLKKPYARADLGRALRAALDHSNENPAATATPE